MIDTQYANFLNGHSPDDGLVKMALSDIEKSGLKPGTVNNAGLKIFNGNSDDLKDRLGRASLNGQNILLLSRLIEIPYYTENGDIFLYRYKLIPSLTDKDRRDAKYLHPIGKPAIPYITPEVWKVKDNTNKPLWITEGEKKALVLIQNGRSAIALSGVWNFKNNNPGDTDLFLELKSFVWRGRTVYLAFDQDLWTNPSVRMALYELALKLHELKAIVRVTQW